MNPSLPGQPPGPPGPGAPPAGREDPIDSAELARRLHLHVRTVRKLTRAGVIPAMRASRRIVRYDYQAVLKALEER
jgi:excisionase family DNA binding protein